MYRFYYSHSKEIIVLGNTNCDDLPVEESSRTYVPFMGNARSNNQKIDTCNQPFRYSDILIWYFATNTPKFIIKSGVKTIGFSDHNLICMRKITDPKKFMNTTNWTRILGLKDIHQCSREQERRFIDLLNKHAPFKHRNVRNTYALYIDKRPEAEDVLQRPLQEETF